MLLLAWLVEEPTMVVVLISFVLSFPRERSAFVVVFVVDFPRDQAGSSSSPIRETKTSLQ
jgi:hypothetical protein